MSALPSNNRLHIAKAGTRWFTRFIAVFIAVCNAFIVPYLVDSISNSIRWIRHNSNRSTIIYLLRSFQGVAIPFGTSLIVLNACGKRWTLLWRECAHSKDTFTWKHSQYIFYLEENYSTYILMDSDVCTVDFSTFLDMAILHLANMWTAVPLRCIRYFATFEKVTRPNRCLHKLKCAIGTLISV